MSQHRASKTRKRIVQAYESLGGGSIREVMEATGLSKFCVRRHLKAVYGPANNQGRRSGAGVAESKPSLTAYTSLTWRQIKANIEAASSAKNAVMFPREVQAKSVPTLTETAKRAYFKAWRRIKRSAALASQERGVA